MPVTPHFYGTYQWLREMKRSGQRTICAVHFRIPDDEIVRLRHFSETGNLVTAAAAARFFHQHGYVPGYEVVIPRAINAREIQAIRRMPQVVGWRYSPNERTSRRPNSLELRGEIGSANLRRRTQRKEALVWHKVAKLDESVNRVYWEGTLVFNRKWLADPRKKRTRRKSKISERSGS
jgi:hypothetical protein